MKKNDWTDIPEKEASINIPDELEGLFHKVGIQLRFLTISGKNENLTICHIMSIAQDYFIEHPEALRAGKP